MPPSNFVAPKVGDDYSKSNYERIDSAAQEARRGWVSWTPPVKGHLGGGRPTTSRWNALGWSRVRRCLALGRLASWRWDGSRPWRRRVAFDGGCYTPPEPGRAHCPPQTPAGRRSSRSNEPVAALRAPGGSPSLLLGPEPAEVPPVLARARARRRPVPRERRRAAFRGRRYARLRAPNRRGSPRRRSPVGWKRRCWSRRGGRAAGLS